VKNRLIATQVLLGVYTKTNIILATITMSNPTGIWMIIRQFQVLLLFIITGAYLPKNVVDFWLD
jgi:hypothetical protein